MTATTSVIRTFAVPFHEIQEAKKELQTSAHDFGGHRADALRSVDEAIHQLQLALEYDKK